MCFIIDYYDDGEKLHVLSKATEVKTSAAVDCFSDEWLSTDFDKKPIVVVVVTFLCSLDLLVVMSY